MKFSAYGWREPAVPPVEEPETPHRRRRGDRKPYRIEERWIGNYTIFGSRHEWYTVGRYTSADRRDQALEDKRRAVSIHSWGQFVEWRAVDP